MTNAPQTPPLAPADALARIREIVGPKGWVDQADAASLLIDERRLYRGRAAGVVKPDKVEQIVDIVAICAAARLPITPQGGNTGLVGGATPGDGGDAILINLGRLNRIRDIDPLNYTITVDAGCILADVQKAAAEVDRLFPLSLGAEGSCTIGGNISTNAGGIQVVRYGNMRELTLGVEAVLPNGTLWKGLRGLRKDNTGYDLKHLFIGGEGTLGLVTGAVLKLFPRPGDVQTALVALPDIEAAIALFSRCRIKTGDRLTAFEILPRFAIEAGQRHVGIVDPLAGPHPWYALIEAAGGDANDGGADLRTTFETLLADANANGIVLDGVVAASKAQAATLWKIRESTWEGQRGEGASIKHDVSIPISSVPEFMRRATAALAEPFDGARIFAFGHVGDGNIHFNLAQPVGGDPDAFLARSREAHDIVHDIIGSLNGSISAEHGIGRLKRKELALYKSKSEIDAMRAVKMALDPLNIMNPGVLLPD